MRRHAREARRLTGDHQRADLGAGSGQDDGQVRHVGGHECRSSPGRDDTGHDEDDGCGIRRRLIDRVERMPHVDVEPRGRESAGHEVALRVVDRGVTVERDGAAGCGAGDECAADQREQTCRAIVRRRAQCAGERDERTVGDAALQLSQHPQLPRLRVVEHRHRFGAELQGRGGPPHRRIRGIEAQHAPILPEQAWAPAVIHSSARAPFG
ncbi:hypothetical protein GCM10025773_14830 [Microbacterium jejuense]